jgi:hypothetical protein
MYVITTTDIHGNRSYLTASVFEAAFQAVIENTKADFFGGFHLEEKTVGEWKLHHNGPEGVTAEIHKTKMVDYHLYLQD